jgi:hypothetical protein
VREEIYVKLLLSTRLANGGLDQLLAAQRRVYLGVGPIVQDLTNPQGHLIDRDKARNHN